VNKSPRVATAVLAATVGIYCASAIPATADPDVHGHLQPHIPGLFSHTQDGSSNPNAAVSETPRANIFDDIGNFFKKIFVNPCERVKCCNNPNHSRTPHC
jgi:hypothetical protein